jgi:hypothetical protein
MRKPSESDGDEEKNQVEKQGSNLKGDYLNVAILLLLYLLQG